MKNSRIAITYTTIEKLAEARQLAKQLQLTIIDSQTNFNNHDYFLIFTPDYLGLISKNHKKPFYIDFLSGKLRYRSKQAGLRKEALAKAMGISPRKQPMIIDATAGLGRDSYILAALGYQVIMLERSAILHALLMDALNRAKNHQEVRPIIEKLNLVSADALSWLASIRHTNELRPDIIYLDPMFPERKKAASVKKEMVILQDLLGYDEDAEKLFELALACAMQKVVVKRPRLAVNISTKTKPNYTIIGQSSRFDVYLIPKS